MESLGTLARAMRQVSCWKGCGDSNIVVTTARELGRSRLRAISRSPRRRAASTSWPKALGRTATGRLGSASGTRVGPRTAQPRRSMRTRIWINSQRIAVVHNGVIENFRQLREHLEELGHTFASATDSEVIAHLVGHCLQELEKANPVGQAAGSAPSRLSVAGRARHARPIAGHLWSGGTVSGPSRRHDRSSVGQPTGGRHRQERTLRGQ